MRITKYTASVTTTTSSTDNFYTEVANGSIRAVQYVRSTSSPISSTADLSITGEVSGINILTSLSVGAASFIKVPMGTAVNTTNGSITAFMAVPVAEERIKVSVSESTAASLTGTFNIYVEGA
jgi:hypothetical protein